MPSVTRTVASGAISTAGYTTIGTLPAGTLAAYVTISDGTAGLVRCGADTVEDVLPANGAFVVYEAGVTGGPLAASLAVTVKATAGTPTAKLTYFVPRSLS